MLDHAKNLEFEKAARVRDQLALLRERGLRRGGAPQRGAAPRHRTARRPSASPADVEGPAATSGFLRVDAQLQPARAVVLGQRADAAGRAGTAPRRGSGSQAVGLAWVAGGDAALPVAPPVELHAQCVRGFGQRIGAAR